MKFVGICAAAALGAASAAGAAETEIYLEEGHVEVQLANGGFIGLAGGADFSILHDETGAPDLIDVRGGAIQLMSAFLDPEPFLVQIGGLTMRMGAGSSVLSVNGDGVVSVLVLNGDGVTVSGPGGDALIGAGTMMIAPPGGEMRTATMTAEALRAQAGAFMGGEAEQDPARIALSLREAVEEHMGRAFNRLEITLAGEAEPEVRWFFRG